MKQKYILINSEKINISNWLRWPMLIGIIYLCLLVIGLVEIVISNTFSISIGSIYVITFYIRGFVVLSLIHDLAPRFKKTSSILWSAFTAFMHIRVDNMVGDKFFLGTLIYIIIIIIYNIFLYMILPRQAKKLNKVGSNEG